MSAVTEDWRAEVPAVAAKLALAKRVAVITGAGMSADSGLPTYRGIGGLYNDIEVEQNMPIEDILHSYTLVRNPALTWKYIAQIGRACRGAGPNDGHRVLAGWDSRFETWVITQNVDGFHRQAGSRNVIEMHGNLSRCYCCACRAAFSDEQLDLETLPPRCAHCDGLVRPDVVLFGEMLPDAALSDYEREVTRGFDVLLAIGTTAGFPYIAEPMLRARRAGAVTVEINPDKTVLSKSVTHRCAGRARDVLLALDAALAEV
ncbi:MAG: NAD-dependent protein deacylase [Gammaproteobacteria bacterium]